MTLRELGHGAGTILQDGVRLLYGQSEWLDSSLLTVAVALILGGFFLVVGLMLIVYALGAIFAIYHYLTDAEYRKENKPSVYRLLKGLSLYFGFILLIVAYLIIFDPA